ncbi:lipopolysaccharide transport periplasmic protein LptA [Hirschia baltica]|uniref:Lipopolysaccharide transport periplasmic protein LptA n=1 Tax=Hirschia baltica (strain ATCC 49814 / DSM 5838 / IFAM 1418) TaxID=582402 RepID=C6XLL7_HIRBI|nr:lipopolysaccharide transport periplasmic protein LptA [Hirschia baltica]ACT57923.1 lipopolysaccharide transport periplasmic protein LptA [Hirschia baltica ATCC 49814]
MFKFKQVAPVFVAIITMLVPAAHAQLGNSRGPIEITADRFELDDVKHEAIYQGNVDVIQGQSRIRANKVVVSYWSKESQKERAAAATGSIGALKEIIATGEVYYITPVEKVKAERGVYNAEKERITLSGNVLVTNAEGVIAGAHLVIDIPKGRYNMDGGGLGGRVTSVFESVGEPPIQ